MRRRRLLLVAGWMCVCTFAAIAQSSNADEEVARRQLESGRSFARQGNHAEALKDFRAVADTHVATSVADNALLEIARYYLDTVGDTKEAAVAVAAILKSYPTSDSAPDAYLMAGRLALTRSRQSADLDAALANFERVFRLFPTSGAVPRSLALAGETLWYAGRFDEALGHIERLGLEYPTNAAAAEGYLTSGRVLLTRGDPLSAMEALQQIRNRWPDSPEAATALARITLLHRLYIRVPGGPAFAATTETAGPARLNSAHSLAVTGRGAIYWANEAAVGVAAPANAPPVPTGVRPRGLTLDTAGNLVIIEAGALRPAGGTPIPLVVPRQNGTPEALKNLRAAVALSNGDWLVMDEDERGIHRFSRTGEYVSVFAPVRLTRLAVNVVDEVAGLDTDQKNVVFLDATGKVTGRLPFKGTGYVLQNPEDLTYDAFGHLYVLDRVSIAVFSPYAPASSTNTAPAPMAGGAAGRKPPAYRLLTLFSEPEKSPGAFRRATAFGVDPSGGVYLYDDRAEKVLVYR